MEALQNVKAVQSLILILLDLSSAFDTVNQHNLLSALFELGNSGTALAAACLSFDQPEKIVVAVWFLILKLK